MRITVFAIVAVAFCLNSNAWAQSGGSRNWGNGAFISAPKEMKVKCRKDAFRVHHIGRRNNRATEQDYARVKEYQAEYFRECMTKALAVR